MQDFATLVADDLDAPDGERMLAVDAGDAAPDDAALAERVLATAGSLAPDGRMMLSGRRVPSHRELASLRNRLWPALHFGRVYRAERGRQVERTDVDGSTKLDSVSDRDGFAVVMMRRELAMSPQTTQQKFDRKASSWNGEPGSPSYGHFRWMRRLLAELGRVMPGETVLDAGSGAGWVGIEAARKGARLSAFDPSPEMVRFVAKNAADLGLAVDARVGFCEDPPFEGGFDLVLNSGVISFAPDAERFLDGIDRMVKPGGRLVIGDLNPLSAGFARRRGQRLVVPCRELNGIPRAEVARRLEQRGYRVDFVRYYQITWPVPEIAHRTANRAVAWLLLQANRAASAIDAALGSPAAGLFDSWIIGATKLAR